MGPLKELLQPRGPACRRFSAPRRVAALAAPSCCSRPSRLAGVGGGRGCAAEGAGLRAAARSLEPLWALSLAHTSAAAMAMRREQNFQRAGPRCARAYGS